VPAFGGERLVASADPDERGLPQAGAGADQRNWPAGLRAPGGHGQELARREIGETEHRGHEIVDDPDAFDSRPGREAPLVDRPGKLRDLRRSRDDGTRDAHSRGRRPAALAGKEFLENRLERRITRARVDARSQEGKPMGSHEDDSDGRLGAAHVGGEHSHRARHYPRFWAETTNPVSTGASRGDRAVNEQIKKTPGRGGAARGAKGGGEVLRTSPSGIAIGSPSGWRR